MHMKKALAAAALALFQMTAWAQEPGKPELNKPEPPMLGLHWARGAQPEARTNAGGGGSGANLVYHNGPILATTDVTAIFWGNSWGNSNYASGKITGLAKFYDGVGGTNYAATTTEFSGSNGQVTTTITNHQAITDASAGPTKAPSTSTILAEVCKVIGSPTTNGYYPVYTDLKRGSAGYCAWHSWGTCGTTNVQFAFFFDLDGDPGCDPGDNVTGNSQGLAALGNVTGHELSEAMTDPRGNGWYDRQGYENSDKCAWTFGTPYLTFPSNGSKWMIQGNWSNTAYTNNYGYANNKGQKGCLDGGNYQLK